MKNNEHVETIRRKYQSLFRVLLNLFCPHDQLPLHNHHNRHDLHHHHHHHHHHHDDHLVLLRDFTLCTREDSDHSSVPVPEVDTLLDPWCWLWSWAWGWWRCWVWILWYVGCWCHALCSYLLIRRSGWCMIPNNDDKWWNWWLIIMRCNLTVLQYGRGYLHTGERENKHKFNDTEEIHLAFSLKSCKSRPSLQFVIYLAA